MAIQVAEPPAEQQKAACREQVGVDDPGERALGKLQTFTDRRQRDVHDRDVKHDHQDTHAQYRERKPAPAVMLFWHGA
jgi:hypothetical protein